MIKCRRQENKLVVAINLPIEEYNRMIDKLREGVEADREAGREYNPFSHDERSQKLRSAQDALRERHPDSASLLTLLYYSFEPHK